SAFRRGGICPGALAARDSRGARGSATVTVSVREPADTCAPPALIAGRGPFPYTLGWNDIAGKPEPTDPQSTCQPGSSRPGSTWFQFAPAATGGNNFSTCTNVTTTGSIYTTPACGPYTAPPRSRATTVGP